MKNPLSVFLLALAAPALAGPALAETPRQLGAHAHGVGTLDIAIDGTTVAMGFEAPGADIVGFEYRATSQADLDAIEAALATLSDPLAVFVLPDAARCEPVAAMATLAGEDGDADTHDTDAHDHGTDDADHADDAHGHGDHGDGDHGDGDHAADGHSGADHSEEDHAGAAHSDDDHAHEDHAEADHAHEDHADGEHADSDHAHGDDAHGDDAHGDHADSDHAGGDHADAGHAEGDHDDHAQGDAHAKASGHTEFQAEYTLSCADVDALDRITFAYFDIFPGAQKVEVQIITASGAQAFEVTRAAPILDLGR